MMACWLKCGCNVNTCSAIYYCVAGMHNKADTITAWEIAILWLRHVVSSYTIFPLHNKLHPMLQMQFTWTSLLPDQLTNILTDIILSIILS